MNLGIGAIINTRDCLAKMLYNFIFEKIISSLNSASTHTSASERIGILDIPGFGEIKI